VLVVYSDGITEYPWRGDQYGEARLAAAVVRLAAAERTARGIANGILQDIRTFAHGGPADDDVTLVVAVRLED
jgi:serine phosphatase RsbU (regulator of sigma subunit)